MAIESRQ